MFNTRILWIAVFVAVFLSGLLLWVGAEFGALPSSAKEVIIEEVSKPHTLTLRGEDESIHSLDLTVEGELDGKATLSLSFSDTAVYKSYSLSPGKVRVSYRGDWYHNFCTVIFEPKNSRKGQLRITYRFRYL